MTWLEWLEVFTLAPTEWSWAHWALVVLVLISGMSGDAVRVDLRNLRKERNNVR